MPCRYIRDGILESVSIEHAGEPAEVLFYRLMLVADDYGRSNAKLKWIERNCWPNGGPNAPSLDDIEARLKALETAKDARGVPLIVRYEVHGEPFLYIPKFGQRTRSLPKYPDPPQGSPQESPNPPTVDGQLPDSRPSHDGQPPGRWRAADSHPQARSRSRSRSVTATAGHMSDNGQARHASHSTEPVQRNREEMSTAAQLAAPAVPKELLDRYGPKTPPIKPFNHVEPDQTDWSSSSDSIDQKGASLGMQRLKLEGDDEYVTRINARINLG